MEPRKEVDLFFWSVFEPVGLLSVFLLVLMLGIVGEEEKRTKKKSKKDYNWRKSKIKQKHIVCNLFSLLHHKFHHSPLSFPFNRKVFQ